MSIEAYEEREKMLAHRVSILAAEAARLAGGRCSAGRSGRKGGGASGAAPPAPELAAYRKLVPTKTYAAAYRLIDDTVIIYHVVNGKTGYPKLLK